MAGNEGGVFASYRRGMREGLGRFWCILGWFRGMGLSVCTRAFHTLYIYQPWNIEMRDLVRGLGLAALGVFGFFVPSQVCTCLMHIFLTHLFSLPPRVYILTARCYLTELFNMLTPSAISAQRVVDEG